MLPEALLSIVKAPEVQWRCSELEGLKKWSEPCMACKIRGLNLIHLFLVEEAESGRYQACPRSSQRHGDMVRSLLVLYG